MRVLLGALAGVLALLGSSVAGAVLEKPDLVLAVGGKTTLYYLPLTVAERKGFFVREGIHLVVVPIPGGTDRIVAALASRFGAELR